MDVQPSLAPRIPVATYRVQLNRLFRFSDAREIVPYLHGLWISDLYSSPYFKAAPGSLHGYDVTDPTSLNPEIGTAGDYDALVDELQRHGMGQILDIVPNHMCIVHNDNVWWMDVLENGPASPYAVFFDVDWQPTAAARLRNKVLLPVLGDQYGKVLEAQELKLVIEQGAFFIEYYDHRFPLLPETYPLILNHRIDVLKRLLGPDSADFAEFEAITASFVRVPRYTEVQPSKIEERHQAKERAKSRLRGLYDRDGTVRSFVDENVAEFNGTKGKPKSFDLLDGLLYRQVYRLSFWRVAGEEINYRRFFNVNSLGAVRMENPLVFRFFHKLVLRLVEEHKITGLRVDHPDGLYDPAAYFSELQRACFFALQRGLMRQVASEVDLDYDDAYFDTEVALRYDAVRATDPGYKAFYIVGEKILTKAERMPEEWPIFSTTGYVFLNSVNGIFVDGRSARAFERIYRQFTGRRTGFQDESYESRKLVIQNDMSGELNTLGRHLNVLSERDRHTRDFTRNNLTDALVEIIASFPVYRTYINGYEVKERDSQYIESAVAKARRRNPAVGSEVYDFVRDVLLLRFPRPFTAKDKREWLAFAMRFQQLTAPVMAKGVEDTAFYRYNRLISLNDVGGNPEKFGTSLDTFHGQNIERAKQWPHALIATSTHDTKIGEDAKARINVLSEMHDRWKDHLHRWHRLNRRKKIIVDGRAAPDRNEEYRLYQILIGTWPETLRTGGTDFETYKKRIREYSIKAAREAKVNTSWAGPDSLYEEAFSLFIEAVLTDGPGNRFLEDFLPFQKKISGYATWNGLSQALLKMTVPGVPDFYQGTELWYYRLVDPDNRDPVDFSAVTEMLKELQRREEKGMLEDLCEKLLATRADGRIKLYVIKRTLAFRNKTRRLFDAGEYLPLETGGSRAAHICAFARRLGGDEIVVCVPRLTATLVFDPSQPPLGAEVWQDTELYVPCTEQGTIYRNLFTGVLLKAGPCAGPSSFSLAEVLRDFPVAFLERLP